MAALAPLDINANVATKSKSEIPAAMKAKAPSQKVHKDHAPPPPAEVHEPKCADRPNGAIYTTGRLLGKGGFAICYEGLLSGTHKLFALKIVKSKMPQKKMEQKFQTELQIHSKMKHPNIVQFHRAFTYQESTYIVLELCPLGSLMDMVKKRRFLTEPEVRYYTIQIAGAIKHMHSRGIIHRDLKMGNIFLDHNMNAKIGDFGLAALLISGKDMATVRRTTLCGTPNYIAPEILEKGRKGHDQAVDIWSLGCIVFAMLTGKPPFQSSTQDEIYRRAKELDYEWPAVDNEIGDDAKDLVKSMLRPPEQRPDCDQIVKHSFFSSGFVPEMKEILPEFLTKAPDSWKFKSGRSSPVHAKNYQELCMKSDVGPWGVPQKMQASLYKEMQAEEKYGLTPSIPLPEGFVYRPFIEVYRELMAVQARRDNHATRLIEREGLDRLAVRQMPTVAGGSTQSYAAQQRAQHQPTLSSAPPRRPKSNTEAESVPRRHPQLDEVRPELSSGERREAPAADTHVRSTFSSVGEPRRSKRQPELTAMSHERKSSARARDDVKQETVNGLSRKVSSSSRTTTSPAEDRLTEGVAKLSIEQTRTRTVLAPKKVLDTILSPTEHTTMLRGSQPDEVLERLRKFHSEISRALKARSFGAGKRAEKGEAPLVVKWVDYTNKFGLGYILNDGTVGCFFRSMPNARNPEKQLPPISVVVRNCERHLQRREDKTYVDRNQLFPITDAADVEFYENRGDSGIMNVKIAAKTYAVSTQPGKVGRLERGKDEWDNKKRENIVLWKKFANYMIGYGRDDIQPTEEDEEDLENVFSKDNVVIFYQRFGDVGVWGFSNGSYQFNFPDHTKIIVSADGAWCDFYHLPLEAAHDLIEKGSIRPSALAERAHLSYSTQSFLNFMAKPSMRTRARTNPDVDPMLQGIPAANDFRRKIEFIKAVVEEWIDCGGVGCGAKDVETRLRWNGYRDTANVTAPIKHVWCTVGAKGGDDRRTAWFDPRKPNEIVPDIEG